MAGKDKPKLLSGGNPQIPKGEGREPVEAYLAAMPEWKGVIGRRVDAIVTRAVPEIHMAVKWNTPLYGIEGDGWFLGMHCFTRYVKVTFFNGAELDPPPPGTSKHERVRYLDIHEEDEIDEEQLAAWFTQASGLPGERM